ncbi:MAG: DoxX family membrane protein [Bacteroidetes bacterium]|nr:DoxX family membrane protein [Bacteroidota bacterium]
MKTLRIISRILVGLVFIFSGFVKGVDPLGTAYRITDYFQAYQMDWAIPLSLTLSIILCSFEFVLGVLLILNVKMKQTAWLVLLMMSFFTIVTFVDAIHNLVPDCGCFGDAVKLTNWQTFYKNVVLMVFVLILFFGKKKDMPWFSNTREWFIIAAFSLLFIWFSVYNYRNLPIINFRPWKVGNKMLSDNPQPIKNYLIYKNKKTGETKEYLSSELPWQDTVWMANWEYDTIRIENPNKSSLGSFSIVDSSGSDYTEHFVRNPEFQFFVAAYDLRTADKEVFKKISIFNEKAKAKGISLIVLSGNSPDEIAKFKKEVNITDLEFYSSDDISLKAMIRSNPGLVLLKKAVVLGQWHYRNFPEFDENEWKQLEKKYVK